MTIFSDDEDNQIECFINEEKRIILLITDNCSGRQNYIKFHKKDVLEVIETLNGLCEELENSLVT